MKNNIDPKVVSSFGEEWTAYDQSKMSSEETENAFKDYFEIFPWDVLGSDAEGFDMGCGSGRWARFVAQRVSKLNCIEPSDAIETAKKNLSDIDNIHFIRGSITDPKILTGSQSFGYCLGVLHHIPDTQSGMKSCVELLKPGAPFLLYIYYNFENRSLSYKLIWQLSNLLRLFISKRSPSVKNLLTDIIALFCYLPISRLSSLIEKLGFNASSMPLYYYRKRSFFTLRTDSRDRFGTILEKRYSRKEIEKMMTNAGLENIRFHDKAPYWCAVGFKGNKVEE